MTSREAPCVVKHLNHVCIAVNNIENSLRLYTMIFGISDTSIQDIEDQGVRAALVQVGGSQLEFIQPTDPKGGVARFIERKGEGIHHICFDVDDLGDTLQRLQTQGVKLIDNVPRSGLSGSIAFIHPKSTNGVLVELVEKQSTGR